MDPRGATELPTKCMTTSLLISIRRSPLLGATETALLGATETALVCSLLKCQEDREPCGSSFISLIAGSTLTEHQGEPALLSD